MKIITRSVQDYLKAIFELVGESRLAGAAALANTTALARRLGLAPASVTGMLQRMAAEEPPLVEYHKGQGVWLTAAGERKALEVIRHHRLLETYLVKMLGYTWDTVHEEACRLEHVISEELEDKIAEALGEPQRDPHGEPIPSRDLVLKADEAQPLGTLRPPSRAIVVRVKADDPGLLRHLTNLGLTPGAQVEVRGYTPFDENLTLSVEGRAEVVVGLAVSGRVFVEVVG